MSTTPETRQPADSRGEGLGCGFFLVIAGCLLLAERMKWIPDTEWLFPVILISWGIGILFQAIRKR